MILPSALREVVLALVLTRMIDCVLGFGDDEQGPPKDCSTRCSVIKMPKQRRTQPTSGRQSLRVAQRRRRIFPYLHHSSTHEPSQSPPWLAGEQVARFISTSAFSDKPEIASNYSPAFLGEAFVVCAKVSLVLSSVFSDGKLWMVFATHPQESGVPKFGVCLQEQFATKNSENLLTEEQTRIS